MAWYRKAAEAGIAEAQYNLAVMYGTGEGVAKDPAQAMEWYKKAAAKGIADITRTYVKQQIKSKFVVIE